MKNLVIAVSCGPVLRASAAAVAACFAGFAIALPTVPTVISGQAAFAMQGKSLTVTNTPGAIIQWRGFSIGADELTRFNQQSSASSVLNRVTGQDPSAILGQLQSNGRVYLINPNGIVFGPGAQIDVAGMVASSLSLSDAEFRAGRLQFQEQGLAGSVVNHGTIRTPSGGQVMLIAPRVENHGLIKTPQGDIVLAAGRKIEIADLGRPRLRIEVAAPQDEALNVGKLVAAGGSIGMYGSLVRNAGRINADAAAVTESGRVVFRRSASGELPVAENEAGRITLSAEYALSLEPGAVVSADGHVAGRIDLYSGGDLSLQLDTKVSANGAVGGAVGAQAATGTLTAQGAIEATGSDGPGGAVRLLGNRVALLPHARVDASGETGGGSVLVGGDYQGRNPEEQNAQRTYVAPGAEIRADAIAAGDGGKVIVWADGDTRFHGDISAHGGANAGNGGFVEVSGKSVLGFDGTVDTSAANGVLGSLLLDPSDITISAAGNSNTTGGTPFTGTAATSNLNVTTLQTALASNNVTVDTTSGSGGPGNITVSSAVTWANASSLTLRAHNNIGVNASITATGTGSMTLLADQDASGAGTLSIGGAGAAGAVTVSTANGSISLAGANVAVTAVGAGGNVLVNAQGAGGALSVQAQNNIDIRGSNAAAGTATMQSAAGQVIVAGGNLTVQGGESAGANALLTNAGAAQYIRLGNNLTVQAGTAAASTAIVQSSAAQTVAAGNDLVIQAGNASGSNATLQVITNNAVQTIDVGRDLRIHGGGSATGATATLAGRTQQNIDVGRDVLISAGTTGSTGNNAVLTNTGTVNDWMSVRAGGNFTEANTAFGRAWIGTPGTGALANTRVYVQAGGDITLGSTLTLSTAGRSIVLRGDVAHAAGSLWGADAFSTGSAASSAVVSNGIGNVTLGGAAAPVAMTMSTSNGGIWLTGANVTVTGGGAGGNVHVNAQGIGGVLDVEAQNNIIIQGSNAAVGGVTMQSAAGQVIVAGGNLTVRGGEYAGSNALLTNAGAAQDIWVGNNLTVKAGTAAASMATVQSSSAQMVAVGNDLVIQAGNANASNAALQVITNNAIQDIDVGRDLRIQGGGAATGATATLAGRAQQDIDVGRDVLLSGGTSGTTGNNAVLTNTGTALSTMTVRAGGNFTEANTAFGRAWIGNAGTGTLATASLDLQAGGDVTLGSNLGVTGGNTISIRADQDFPIAGALWGANAFFGGSMQSSAQSANGLGAVIVSSNLAATPVQLTSASGAITVVSADQTTAGAAADLAIGAGVATRLSFSTTSGNIAVGDAGAGNHSFRNVTVAGPIATSGAVVIEANNDLTLSGTVSAGGTGDAIVLAAGRNFANTAGAGALSTPSGRWLVYSTDPRNDARDGLAYEFKQYNISYGGLTPVAGSGKGFLYTVAPSITPALAGTVTKVYDAAVSATLAAGNYSTDAIDGDTVALNSPTSGSYDTKDVGTGKNVSVSGLAITSATNGAATVYGYQLASTTASAGIGTITSLGITGSVMADDKTYDGNTSATIATRSLSGAISGDTVGYTGGVATFSDKNAAAGKTVTATGLGLSGADAGNYTVNTTASATASITPASLSVAANDASRPVAQPNPPFIASFAGFKPGETPAVLGGALQFATSAGISSPAGAYSIVPSGLTATNYTISYVSGTLSVQNAPAPSSVSTSAPAFGLPADFDPLKAVGNYALVAGPTYGVVNGNATAWLAYETVALDDGLDIEELNRLQATAGGADGEPAPEMQALAPPCSDSTPVALLRCTRVRER